MKMCEETDSKRKQRYTYQQTVSVRDKIISDDESTETLIYMVGCAKNVLTSNYNYFTFRTMVAGLVLKIDEDDLEPSLFCAMDDLDKRDLEKRSKMVDCFINQLLRFLAMKVLLEGNDRETGSNGGIQERTDENGNKLLLLNPSIAVRECWKALLMLPLTYRDVCKAFGCDAIDYDEEVAGFLGEESKGSWGRECYQWTIKTYTILYSIPPSKLFWPKLPPEESDGLLTTLVTKLGESLNNAKAEDK